MPVTTDILSKVSFHLVQASAHLSRDVFFICVADQACGSTPGLPDIFCFSFRLHLAGTAPAFASTLTLALVFPLPRALAVTGLCRAQVRTNLPYLSPLLSLQNARKA